MHLGFDREYCISRGTLSLKLNISKKAHTGNKNIAGSKIRLISNIEQKILVTYDLQHGDLVVAKMEMSQNFGNLKKLVKNAYFGTLHTFNIFHSKTFDPKCGKNNILKNFVHMTLVGQFTDFFLGHVA